MYYVSTLYNIYFIYVFYIYANETLQVLGENLYEDANSSV